MIGSPPRAPLGGLQHSLRPPSLIWVENLIVWAALSLIGYYSVVVVIIAVRGRY